MYIVQHMLIIICFLSFTPSGEVAVHDTPSVRSNNQALPRRANLFFSVQTLGVFSILVK